MKLESKSLADIAAEMSLLAAWDVVQLSSEQLMHWHNIIRQEVMLATDDDEWLCCNGADCGCRGATKRQYREALLTQRHGAGDGVKVVDAEPNKDMDITLADRHHLFVYEVDFGDEGKGRYIRLRDFNAVVSKLEALLTQRDQGGVRGDAGFNQRLAKSQVPLSQEDASLIHGNLNNLLISDESDKDEVWDGLSASTFGDWCNTLTHAYMYITERQHGNAQSGIKEVLDDLRAWQRKLAAAPHKDDA